MFWLWRCCLNIRRRSPLVYIAALLAIASAACSVAANSPSPLELPTSAAITVLPTIGLPADAFNKRPNDPALRAMLDTVQSDRLMVAVSTLADMQTRHVLSAKNDPNHGIGAAQAWLVAQFTAIRDSNPRQPIDVWTQPINFTWNRANVQSANVVAIFQGTEVGAGVILLGAHYDSISVDFLSGTALAPGANEDGSGIAALLEIAHILAPRPHRATIMFVAFTAEETGRQGSLAFVNSYLQAQNPPIALRGMIDLDMIGSQNGPNGQVDPSTIRVFSAEPNDSPSRQLARQLALFVSLYMDNGDSSGANLVLQSAEERLGRWGDHQSFSAAGYPSLRLIQGLEDLSREHTMYDTLDGVQPAYLMQSTRVALLGATILADGLTPPDTIRLRARGGDAAAQMLSWSAVPGASGYLLALRQNSSLAYDQILIVDAITEVTWDSFSKYGTLAIAAIDANGEIGPLSPEVSIPAMLRIVTLPRSQVTRGFDLDPLMRVLHTVPRESLGQNQVGQYFGMLAITNSPTMLLKLACMSMVSRCGMSFVASC